MERPLLSESSPGILPVSPLSVWRSSDRPGSTRPSMRGPMSPHCGRTEVGCSLTRGVSRSCQGRLQQLTLNSCKRPSGHRSRLQPPTCQRDGRFSVGSSRGRRQRDVLRGRSCRLSRSQVRRRQHHCCLGRWLYLHCSEQLLCCSHCPSPCRCAEIGAAGGYGEVSCWGGTTTSPGCKATGGSVAAV